MTTADPTLRDRLMFAAMRVPLLRRWRCWWRDRKGRPGWRPSDYR